MRTLFHLSPVENRDSILRHGLDPCRMGTAPGLANSTRRELDGVYVSATREDVDWFVETMGPAHPAGLDLWAIDVAHDEVLQTGTSGYDYLPTPVPPERVALVETFEPPYPDPFADAPDAVDGLRDLDGENRTTVAWNVGTDVDAPLGVAILDSENVAWDAAPAPRHGPLPDWLAPIVEAVVHDVTGARPAEAGIALGYAADAVDETYVGVQLLDPRGVWTGELGFSLELSAPQVAVELATALQRWWVERPHVEGTLHPPCPGHRHAAVAVEHGGAAWWSCPADGRRLARHGALR